MLRYLPLLLVLALWIYAFIDCLNTPEDEVKGLPKLAWVFIILLFGQVLVGPVAWFVAGKVRKTPASGITPSPQAAVRNSSLPTTTPNSSSPSRTRRTRTRTRSAATTPRTTDKLYAAEPSEAGNAPLGRGMCGPDTCLA